MITSEKNCPVWSGYNNPGIAAIAIGTTLNHCQTLSLAKTLLIMPLVMHAPTVKHLANKINRAREISALTAIRPDFVHNFSQRYHASLSHTINGIQLLHGLSLITYSNIITQSKPFEIDSKFGNRAQLIASASQKIAHLLRSSEEELYLNLRVQL